MRSAEWQVAAGVADFIQVAASGLLRLVASGQLRQAGSGPQALQDLVQPPVVDSDQGPASAHLFRGPAVFHLLLQLVEHSHRGVLYPAIVSL